MGVRFWRRGPAAAPGVRCAMRHRAGYLLVAAGLLLVGALPMARAARVQQGRTRILNACVALIPTPDEPQTLPVSNPYHPNMGSAAPDPDAISILRSPNPYPYVFYVLDQRSDLKPDGWRFQNPAAPGYVTTAQATRWGLVAGTPLKSSMGAYWETTLSSANYERLSQMDVIYLPISRNNGSSALVTNFTEDQRRVLARLADAGVAIWVDWALPLATAPEMLGGIDGSGVSKNPFFTNLDFATTNSSGGSVSTGSLHPLLTSHFFISSTDAPQIGSLWGNKPSPSTGRGMNIRSYDIQPTSNFETVVDSSPSGTPYIAAARYGAGYVIGTAGNCGKAIAGMIGATVKQVTTQDLGTAETEDLEFAYNIFAWISEVTSSQKNGRHIGQSSVEADGLIEQSTYPHLLRPTAAGGTWLPYSRVTTNLIPSNPASPLVVNGFVVAPVRWKDASGVVHSEINAFKLNPGDDVNQDGYNDDPTPAGTASTNPLVDVSLGLNYDRVLGIDVPYTGPVLGNTIGTVYSAGGNQSYLFFAGPSGLFSLPAPRPGTALSANFWQATSQMAPDFNVFYTGSPAFASVPGRLLNPASLPGGGNPYLISNQLFAGGRVRQPLFGTANAGKLLGLDVQPGGSVSPAWYYPPNQESNRLGFLSGPVVTAQIQDIGTGAVDTMVFVTSCSAGDASGQQNGGAAGDTTGKVEGFIIATRGDVLGFPRGNNVGGAANPAAGRQLVSVRWLDISPGTGVPPTPRELMWDPNKYYEVRVLDKVTGYTLARYSGTQLTLLPNGTAGQVQLPAPPLAWSVNGDQTNWDLSKVTIVADYSVLPQAVDASATSSGATIRPRFSPPTPYYRSSLSNGNQVQPTGIAGGVAVGKDGLIYYNTGQGYMCGTEWRRGRHIFRWKMRSLNYQDGTGTSTDIDPDSASYLADYTFTTAPTAGNRILFTERGRKNSGDGSTIYSVDPDATVRFKLVTPSNFPRLTETHALDVMLEADHGVGVNPQSPWLLASQQPWGRVSNQFTVDPSTMTVTFLNMENFSLNLRAALSPSELMARGIDTGGRPAVPIRWCLRNAQPFEPTANDPFTAYIPVPLSMIYSSSSPVSGVPTERWTSAAVISGKRIYVMGSSGFLHELPVDPRTVDPSFPKPANQLLGLNVGNTALYPPNGLRKLRDVASDPQGSASDMAMASPAIGDGIVAVNTRRGLKLYKSPHVVVADSNRIVEASGDSTALASTAATVKNRVDNSEFAIPTDPSLADTGGRPVITERTHLNHPSVVRKLDRSSSLTSLFLSTANLVPIVDTVGGIQEHTAFAIDSLLAADTGNDRCVEFNASGNVIWELKDFQDPLGILPAGESLKLFGPMDVQRWIETETVNGVTLYDVHTLIADTGNTRVLEIVDKVNYQRGKFTADSYPFIPGQVAADGTTPIRWYHVLVWSSQTNAQGLKLKYKSAQRIFWTDANGQAVATAAPSGGASAVPPYLPNERYLSYTMCGVSGQRVTYNDPVTPSLSGYHQFYSGGPQGLSVSERKPTAAPGGDSIVFLRGRYKVDESSATPIPVGASAPFDVREPRVGGSGGGDRFRFAQGVVDPNVPIITDVYDAMNGATAVSNNIVHTLRGVSSIQRTVRSDVKFAPEAYGSGVMEKAVYFLVTDADGVWEFRMLPSLRVPAGSGPFRLAWSFNTIDYAYVTGAGNGDPTQVLTNSTAAQTPGGRLLSAASARRMPNGLVLVASRTPGRDGTPGFLTGSPVFGNLHAGADVFLLNPADYVTPAEPNGNVPYNFVDVATHGWVPDLWLRLNGAVPALLRSRPSSIRWRAAEQVDATKAPTPQDLTGNPNELTGTYLPIQPNYADLVF